MKNALLVIAGILIVLLAGFYFYSKRITEETPVSLLDFVPEDAVFIYENKKPSYAKKESPDYATWLRRSLRQDSIFISPLRSKEVTLSLHITGKEDFGILYYLSDSSILKDVAFKKLLKKVPQRRRNFEGYNIIELPATNKGSISYTTIDQNIIISRQALLIEDVIRSQQKDETGFRKNNDALFHLMPVDAGQGKVYANINSLAKFCSLFLDKEIGNSLFKNLGSAVITDAKIENQTLALNGYATDSAAQKISILSLFNDQHPVASEIQKIVSNRALIFIHYGISDFKSWNKRRAAYKPFYPALNPKTSPPADFYTNLGAESGYCYLSGAKGETTDVMILQARKGTGEKLTAFLSADKEPSENYSNYLIYPVNTPETIRDLMWPLNENKSLNYFTRIDEFFLFAENMDVLKGFINDVEEDNTWGKSSEWNTFFNAASLETNLSVEFNGSLLTSWVMNKLSAHWDSLSLPREIGSLQKGSFQFSRLNQSYYFNGVLQFDTQKKRAVSTKEDVSIPQISFPEPVTYFSLVKNHNNNSPELLIQTTANTLALVADDFKVLFKTNLKDKIRSHIYQIDYYKNKKLQYLFLAGRSLYLMDRLGNDVTGFPKVIETAVEPEFISPIDYDNTKNYRFLIADQKGNLQMLNKEGKLLEEWSSVSIQARLLSAARLVRSGGKDFVIAVDVQGKINAFNRRGEVINGFPVASGIKPQGDWFFEKNAASGEDVLTLVSIEGTKVQINMKGKIVNKENYVRSAPDSKFELIVAPSVDEYVISRVDKGKIAALNRKGEVIFEKENPGSDIMEVSLVLVGGEKVFCFRDAQQDFTHIYNEAGQTILQRPLESSQLPAIARKGKEGLIIFTVFDADVKRISR